MTTMEQRPPITVGGGKSGLRLHNSWWKVVRRPDGVKPKGKEGPWMLTIEDLNPQVELRFATLRRRELFRLAVWLLRQAIRFT